MRGGSGEGGRGGGGEGVPWGGSEEGVSTRGNQEGVRWGGSEGVLAGVDLFNKAAKSPKSQKYSSCAPATESQHSTCVIMM